MGESRFCWHEFENDDDLIQFRANDGIPYWFYLRELLIGKIDSYLLGTKQRPRQAVNEILKISSYVAHSVILRHNWKLADSQIIFFVPGRYSVGIDGLSENLLADYFADLYSDNCCVVERAPLNWAWQKQRKFQSVIDVSFDLAVAELLSKKKYSAVNSRLEPFIKYVAGRLPLYLPTKMMDEQLKKIVSTMGIEFALAETVADVLITKISTSVRIVFMVGGFRSRFSPLVKRLRDRGVRVAELQHGMFTQGDCQYNVHERFRDDKRYKQIIPDDFLLYGDYWKTQCNLNTNKINIGSPYHDSKLQTKKTVSKTDILLIGCCHDTEKYLEFAKRLGSSLPEYRIVFRPHPNEFLPDLSSSNNTCVIDNSTNLYEAFAAAKLVLSEFSTVLFEAVGFVDYIALWDTPYSRSRMSDRLFPDVVDVSDVIKLLQLDTDLQNVENYFWANNSKQRFDQYINGIYHNEVGKGLKVKKL